MRWISYLTWMSWSNIEEKNENESKTKREQHKWRFTGGLTEKGLSSGNACGSIFGCVGGRRFRSTWVFLYSQRPFASLLPNFPSLNPLGLLSKKDGGSEHLESRLRRDLEREERKNNMKNCKARTELKNIHTTMFTTTVVEESWGIFSTHKFRPRTQHKID